MTGECPQGCHHTGWGVGCLLSKETVDFIYIEQFVYLAVALSMSAVETVHTFTDNSCTYNDGSGVAYMGKHTTTEQGRTCVSWSRQKAYPDGQFYDKSRKKVRQCRNQIHTYIICTVQPDIKPIKSWKLHIID